MLYVHIHCPVPSVLQCFEKQSEKGAIFSLRHNLRRSSHSRIPIDVPTGLAQFPEEPYLMPRAVLESKYRNIVTYTDMPNGGHFAAFEDPKLLATDFFGFVQKVETERKRSKVATKSEL